MTDHDRRRTDPRFDELEQSIKTHIDDTLCKHIEDDHYGLSKTEVSALIDRGDKRETTVERIIEMIEGTPVIDLHGNTTGHKAGIQTMVSEIYERTNGGVNVTQKITPEWTRKQKIALASVVSMFTVGVLSSLVTLIAVFIHA